MRPTSVSVGSATFSTWIPLDSRNYNFQVGLAVGISSGASLTYSVQHTFDNFWENRTDRYSISRTTTTATVTKVAHGLTAADWISVQGVAPFNGDFAVASVTDADTFTYTVANSGATSQGIGTGNYISTAHVFPHSVVAAKTTNVDGNYQFPPFATRLIISSYTSGTATLTVIQQG